QPVTVVDARTCMGEGGTVRSHRVSGDRAVGVGLARGRDDLAGRAGDWDSAQIEAVVHDGGVVWFVVEAIAPAVQQAKVMSQLVHGKASPPLYGNGGDIGHDAGVDEGLRRDDGIVAPDLRGAGVPGLRRLGGDRTTGRIFRIGRTVAARPTTVRR